MNRETRQWITGILLLLLSAYNFGVLLSVIRDGVFAFSSVFYILWGVISGVYGIHYFIKGIE